MIEILIRAEEGEWTSLMEQFLSQWQGTKVQKMQCKEATEVQTPSYTLEEVRTKAYKLCEQGKRQEVLNLLATYGKKRITELKEEEYVSFMEKVGEIR